MKYYLVECEYHDGGDDMGVNDQTISMVIAAPNNIAASHVAGKNLIDESLSEDGRKNAKWDLWTDINRLGFFGSSVSIFKLVEIPQEHFKVLSQYFESHEYSYDVMADYGDYADIFPKDVVCNLGLHEELYFIDVLQGELNKYIAESEIKSVALRPLYFEDFKTVIALHIAMKSGAQYVSKVLTECKSAQEVTYIREQGFAFEACLKSSNSIGVHPSNNFDVDKTSSDKDCIRQFLKAAGSDVFKKFAMKAIEQQLKQG